MLVTVGVTPVSKVAVLVGSVVESVAVTLGVGVLEGLPSGVLDAMGTGVNVGVTLGGVEIGVVTGKGVDEGVGVWLEIGVLVGGDVGDWVATTATSVAMIGVVSSGETMTSCDSWVEGNRGFGDIIRLTSRYQICCIGTRRPQPTGPSHIRHLPSTDKDNPSLANLRKAASDPEAGTSISGPVNDQVAGDKRASLLQTGIGTDLYWPVT